MRAIILGVFFVVFLSACGGGGSGGTNPPPIDIVEIRIGTLDGGLVGMTYSSGSTSGTLSADGMFMYEVINDVVQTVTFSIGNISIATVTGAEVLTILNFVASESIDSPELHNIISLLIFLDEDQNIANGLTLSSELIEYFSNNSFDSIDFSDPDFVNQNAVIMLLAEVTSVESDGRVLLDPGVAGETLIQDQMCRSSGLYNGNFDGDDDGYFVVAVDLLGGVFGVGFSNFSQSLFAVDGSFALTGNTSNFTAGDTSTGASFAGSINNFTTLSGSWENTFTDDEGSFSGNRVSNNANEKFRYVLGFTDDTPADQTGDDIRNFGFAQVRVFDDDTVTASMINFNNERYDLSGVLFENADTADDENLKAVLLNSADEAVLMAGALTLVPDPVDPDLPRAFGGIYNNTNTGLVAGLFYGFGCRVN